MANLRFINRLEELKSLDKAYSSRKSAFVVIYGRRRVGKTALIREFLKDKPGVYFLATREAELENRLSFQEQLSAVLKQPYLQSAGELSWELMFEEIARSTKNERLVVAIDEFQYLGLVDPAFPSKLQKIWDTTLCRANVMLILCGSLLSLMEDQVLNYNSPLYGRRTAQIKLGPIAYHYYDQFYPADYSLQDLLWRYGLTGGIPRYIEALSAVDRGTGLDRFWEALSEAILDRNAMLYEEPFFLLGREVKEIGNYFSVLKSIADGNHKAGKIAGALQIKEINLRHYLKTLSDLNIVQRLVPVTEKQPEKSKLSQYVIGDEFLRFWFRFIYPNRSLLEMEQKTTVLAKIKASLVEEHLSYVYETVCLQNLILRASAEFPEAGFNRFGKWWNRQEEIDLVALSDGHGAIAVGECKLTRKPADLDLLQRLRRKAEKINWGAPDRPEYYLIYSYSGFSDKLKQLAAADENVRLFTLS